ncbi:SHOCT domain-containing protein [Ramlibacter ginsenosidimutans]|nr:SHOCT domain-containing protein [Ramlibacter ginsenosidimutans]
MWHQMWGWNGGGWGWFGLGHVLWWVLLFGGLLLLARSVAAGGSKRTDTALDILRERYARGEIDEAEYQARLKQLKA